MIVVLLLRSSKVNVNYGRNQKLLEACKPMKEYSWLIEEIRKNRKSMEIGDAVNKALEDMPEDFTIKPFLDEHKKEVYGMLETEYNEAEALELFRQEGADNKTVECIKNIMETLKLTAKQAMDALKIPVSDQPKYASKL